MGEDLASMSLKELQSLEQQLDTSLKNIRNRRVRVEHIPYYVNLLSYFMLCV